MGKSKRSCNLDQNTRTQELLISINNDKSRVLGPVGLDHVSRKDAMRVYKLTETDLESVNHLAVNSLKCGQWGVFYPSYCIRALELEKYLAQKIDADMISEAVILRQIPKHQQQAHANFKKQLRSKGVKGTRDGHRGPPTYFYKVGIIEEFLGVRVIPPGSVEGVDFIESKNVPKKIQDELSASPIYSIRARGVKGKAEMCFFEPEVSQILKKGCTGLPQLRISRRTALKKNSDLTGRDQLGGGQQNSEMSEELQRSQPSVVQPSLVSGAQPSLVSVGQPSMVSVGQPSLVSAGQPGLVTGLAQRDSLVGIGQPSLRSREQLGQASLFSGGQASLFQGGQASLLSGGQASLLSGGQASLFSGCHPSLLSGGQPSMFGGGPLSQISGDQLSDGALPGNCDNEEQVLNTAFLGN